MRFGADREFLSCDWGTSHFRLKWIADGKVAAEFQDANGCKTLLQKATAGTQSDRAKLFEKQLQSALGKLFTSQKRPAKGSLPLIISGMASSTIGWRELPYARTPVPLDGTQLRTELVAWDSLEFVDKTILISGIATETNMMRGEETEAIGLLSLVSIPPSELVLLLPGTHSKHLYITDGILREIRTYMTGELFAVLTQHSVLAASVSPRADFNAEGFFAGVEAARTEGLPAALFHTRTRQVLAQRPGDENAAFLSGLLIGAELHDLLTAGAPEILLGGAPSLRDLYGKVLGHLAYKNWRAFSDAECESAVVRGHEIILAKLK